MATTAFPPSISKPHLQLRPPDDQSTADDGMAGPMDVTFGEDMSPKFHRSYGICPYRQGLLDVPQENLETVDILSDSTTSEDGEFEARRGEQWDDPWNTPGSPATTADMGEFPLKAQQARLSAQVVQDSSATKSLTRNGGDNLQSASKEFLKSTDLYVLLVWWYNIAIGLPSRRFCQQMAVFITSATVVVILEVQSSALQPQSWIFILLENQKGWRPGRWIGEYSVDWIDTTWRTAHSVLHGGAISPVAGLPWVNPARLRALWGACQRRSECTIDAQELAGPSDLYYTLPIRTHPNNQKRRPNNTSSDAPERAKRPRQSAGNGGGPKKDGGEDNNSNNNDDNPPNKNNPNLPKKSNSKGSNPAGLPFACPFFKKCPLKHLRCLFRLQQAARHMKTHLERDHMLSPCCPICFETFETRALHDTHVRGKSCTAPSQPPERDGINEDQWLELGEMPRNSNEDAKWYEMWDILFPGRTRPASPRVDPSDFEGIVVDAVREAREAVFLEGLLELEQQGNLNREQVIGLFRRALVGTNASQRPETAPASRQPTSHQQPLQPPVEQPLPTNHAAYFGSSSQAPSHPLGFDAQQQPQFDQRPRPQQIRQGPSQYLQQGGQFSSLQSMQPPPLGSRFGVQRTQLRNNPRPQQFVQPQVLQPSYYDGKPSLPQQQQPRQQHFHQVYPRQFPQHNQPSWPDGRNAQPLHRNPPQYPANTNMSPSVTTGYPHVQRSSASLPSAQAHNALPHRYAPAPGGMPTADPNPYQARAATNTSPNEINYGYTVSDEDWNDIMEMEPPHGEGVLLSPEVPRAWTGEPMYQDTNGPQLMILDNVVYHIDHNLPRNEPSQADRAGRPRSPNATQPAQFTTPGVPHEVDEDADADAETDADAFADADADADAVAGADADDLQAEQGLPSPIAPTTLSEVGSDYFDV